MNHQELSDLLNTGIPKGRQLEFDGNVCVNSHLGDFSLDYTGIKMVIERAPSQDARIKYGITLPKQENYFLMFGVDENKPVRADPLGHGVEILMDHAQILWIRPVHIRY